MLPAVGPDVWSGGTYIYIILSVDYIDIKMIAQQTKGAIRRL